MITISIDLKLLQKHRFKSVTRKNGKEALFCDLILIETPEGKYGDYMVKQGVTPEERANRVEMPILGNGKSVGNKSSQPKTNVPAPEEDDGDGDPVPF